MVVLPGDWDSFAGFDDFPNPNAVSAERFPAPNAAASALFATPLGLLSVLSPALPCSATCAAEELAAPAEEDLRYCLRTLTSALPPLTSLGFIAKRRSPVLGTCLLSSLDRVRLGGGKTGVRETPFEAPCGACNTLGFDDPCLRGGETLSTDLVPTKPDW